MQTILLNFGRRRRMRIAVALCRQTQNKRSDDESNDAFLFRRENEFVSQLLPLPTFGEFQY